ncbi:MAG: DUF455 family protein [Gemmatimonadales bacterium]
MTGYAEYFGDLPAREPRYQVAERWVDCVNFPDGTPEWRMEFFHRQMNEELNVLENAARHLVEFPEVEWNLRMWLARQCADEARHTIAYKELFERRGGTLGEYPVMNFQYRILSRIPHLIGRLAVQNRSFEAEGLDAATFALGEARAMGDDELVELFEQQQADEVLHIKFANDWIRRQVAEDGRNVLKMAIGLNQGAAAFEQVMDGGGTHVTKYGVAEQERLEAGFEPEEIKVAIGLSKARADAAAAPRGGA